MGTITSLTYCLLNRLFRRRSKKTSKLRVTGLCAGNLPVTGEFPAQMASNAENVSIWWRHHVIDDIWNTPGIRPMFFLVEGCSLRCGLWGLTIGLDIGLEPNRRHDRYEICPLPVYLLLCLILFVFVLHSVCIYYSISFTAKYSWKQFNLKANPYPREYLEQLFVEVYRFYVLFWWSSQTQIIFFHSINHSIHRQISWFNLCVPSLEK